MSASQPHPRNCGCALYGLALIKITWPHSQMWSHLLLFPHTARASAAIRYYWDQDEDAWFQHSARRDGEQLCDHPGRRRGNCRAPVV